MPKSQPRTPSALLPSADPTTIWSTWVQSVEWIDPDRERRFRDEVRDILWPVLGLRPGACVSAMEVPPGDRISSSPAEPAAPTQQRRAIQSLPVP